MAILTRNHRIVAINDTTCQMQLTNMMGESKAMVFNAHAADVQAGFADYSEGALIQNAFPMLTMEEREFIMTGMTPEQWEETMGSDE